MLKEPGEKVKNSCGERRHLNECRRVRLPRYRPIDKFQAGTSFLFCEVKLNTFRKKNIEVQHEPSQRRSSSYTDGNYVSGDIRHLHWSTLLGASSEGRANSSNHVFPDNTPPKDSSFRMSCTKLFYHIPQNKQSVATDWDWQNTSYSRSRKLLQNTSYSRSSKLFSDCSCCLLPCCQDKLGELSKKKNRLCKISMFEAFCHVR